MNQPTEEPAAENQVPASPHPVGELGESTPGIPEEGAAAADPAGAQSLPAGGGAAF